ncbi:MAG: hypothetical protein J7599_07605 [Niabella sp.]|nr:hypothetical protein [Niabella sp.]
MEIDKFYKAQDLLRQINIIETVISCETIDEKALDKLDVALRNKTKENISTYAKKELKRLKNDLEKEFNDL